MSETWDMHSGKKKGTPNRPVNEIPHAKTLLHFLSVVASHAQAKLRIRKAVYIGKSSHYLPAQSNDNDAAVVVAVNTTKMVNIILCTFITRTPSRFGI